MSAIAKHVNIEKGFGPAILSDQVKNHDDDPFVVKKVEKAKETLKKVSLPDFKNK